MLTAANVVGPGLWTDNTVVAVKGATCLQCVRPARVRVHRVACRGQGVGQGLGQVSNLAPARRTRALILQVIDVSAYQRVSPCC